MLPKIEISYYIGLWSIGEWTAPYSERNVRPISQGKLRQILLIKFKKVILNYTLNFSWQVPFSVPVKFPFVSGLFILYKVLIPQQKLASILISHNENRTYAMFQVNNDEINQKIRHNKVIHTMRNEKEPFIIKAF